MATKQTCGFFELEAWEKGYVKKRLPKSDLLFFEEPLSEKNAHKVADCTVIGAFIYSDFSKKILGKLPLVRFIGAMSTGFDHIDIDACKKKGIIVSNVPSYGENTVAEHTFALLLSLSRKIHKTYDNVLHNNFSLEGLRGFDLKGKTIGIIGCGNIGQHVARIAKGFEMNILVFDLHANKELSKKIGFTYADMDILLGKSDIISLHCPYNKYTHHIINKNSMKKVKKGSIILNTARGALIETDALVKALANGTIAYAGLDVLEEEANIKEEKQLLSREFSRRGNIKTALENHVLIHQPNVLFTPHNAFNSEEALKRILDTTIENIQAFANNKPINVIS